MFDLNLGRIGLSPRPDYQPGQAAAPLDLVHCGGNLWVCTAPTTDAPADGHAAWMPAAKGGLMRLTSDLTIYVREDGDDANTGLEDSPQGAFKTPQAALDHVARTYHLDVHTLTVNIGPGTFPGFQCLPCRAFTGSLVLQGAGNGTIIQAVNANAVVLHPSTTKCALQNMALHVRVTASGTATRHGILSQEGYQVTVSNVHIRMDEDVRNSGYVYGVSCRGGLVTLQEGVVLEMTPPANGSQRLCALSAEGGHLRMNSTVTVSGAVRYTLRLMNQGYFSRNTSNDAHFLGAFSSGVRYWITGCSACQTGGGGEEFFPGTSVGVLDTGGQYFP